MKDRELCVHGNRIQTIKSRGQGFVYSVNHFLVSCHWIFSPETKPSCSEKVQWEQMKLWRETDASPALCRQQAPVIEYKHRQVSSDEDYEYQTVFTGGYSAYKKRGICASLDSHYLCKSTCWHPGLCSGLETNWSVTASCHLKQAKQHRLSDLIQGSLTYRSVQVQP